MFNEIYVIKSKKHSNEKIVTCGDIRALPAYYKVTITSAISLK